MGRQTLSRQPRQQSNGHEPGDKFDLRGNFLDSIEHGTPGVADVNWALKVMSVIDAIFESAKSGKVVKLLP